MFVNGQQVIVYMTEERHLSINVVPGKSKHKFAGRVWINGKNPNVISITNVPTNYEPGPVYPPPGWTVQGIDQDAKKE